MKVDFETYSRAYPHVRMTRDDGILLMTLHSDDGALQWGDGPHTELGYCFQDVGSDPDNRVIVLTGAGGYFIGHLDESWVGPMNPAKWDKIYHHGRRLLMALLEIEAPVVAAVNGPARVHPEIAALSDIVIASTTAYFQDAPHFRFGTVPSDGAHIIWPHLLGPNRGRAFLLQATRISAEKALELGLAAEVVPPQQVVPRALEVARELAKQPDTTLRYARAAITQRLKALLLDGIGFGLALEGLGAYASWPTVDEEN
jgi:enoyl-CoA hydratase/carnithine racemase